MKKVLAILLRVFIALIVLWFVAGVILDQFVSRAKKNIKVWHVEGTPPIKTVRFQTDRKGIIRSVEVRTTTNTPLVQVVDLSPFGDFRPDTPLKAVVEQFGPPTKVGEPQSSRYPVQDWQYFTFTNSLAEIQLLMSRSGGETNWTVVASPITTGYAFSATGILSRAILQYLPREDRDLTLWVFDGDESELADCRIRGNTVSEIRWASLSPRTGK
jgi:hypothetical protein